MKVIFKRQENRNGYAIWIMTDDGKRLHVAMPATLTFEEKDYNSAWLLPEPTFQLSTRDFDELKASLLEEMQRAGMVDLESARELKATRYHLEDMRMLALNEAKR